jgi:hypothetical protein
MNVLRLFVSDQAISRRTLFIALGALVWFGVSVNALYDLWKLFPTVFIKNSVIDWWSFSLCLLPPLSFLAFIMWYVYPRYLALIKKDSEKMIEKGAVHKHKGIILAVSMPMVEGVKISPDAIVNQIHMAANADSLYSIRGIGQLFRGLYYHYGVLRYVWPLTTQESKTYRICIEKFIEKFMPDVSCAESVCCELPQQNSEIEMIESTKKVIAAIYSQETLNTVVLKPSDIIVDITGGTKAISIGLTFGALDSAIDLQYVEQRKYDVIPLAITPEIILDKVGNYLLELYSKLHNVCEAVK